MGADSALQTTRYSVRALALSQAGYSGLSAQSGTNGHSTDSGETWTGARFD